MDKHDLIEFAQWIEDKLDVLREREYQGDVTELKAAGINGEARGYLEVLVHLQKYGVAIVNGRAEAFR